MNFVEREKVLFRISKIFARLQYKINFDLRNTSSVLLATDILRTNTKRELFKITSLKLEKVLLDRLKNITDISTWQSQSLCLSLLQETTEEFLTSFYGFPISVRTNLITDLFYTNTLLEEERILFTVPYQIIKNDEQKFFRAIFMPVYDNVSESFIESLIDNLVVEITNVVSIFILNEFSLINDVRKSLYRSNFLSLRNVERFRNNLSWQYRIKVLIRRPAAIYNSQYGIWVIRTTGIYYRVIYANQSWELINLKGFSLLTLFVIEAKDFVFSRIEESVYLFGNTIQYIVTSILGQSIALIWRGFIDGLKK